VWGAVPVVVPTIGSYEDMVAAGLRVAAERGLANAGDRVVVTAGVPVGVPGTTNTLKVETVPADAAAAA
jgi:pyruvate kinase